ncbi:flagellar hook-associated protein FlgK [Rhodospira trueperi]|uniref:Flagellar hook-associated protein 1 n=1 Tax=Rhodospira trueperi TaxID=69960 RepID=A0A1G7FJB5_9PROT|nr:flagellar hook-associated protein FlgK [Rhodospira trueperi]SDE76004.1 flagellar hook-associated protein 1 FlgK [Rhodospira trueperi]
MSLTQALNTGLLGLQVSQKGLDLVSRNIANVNTPGYTKKVFNQESLVLNGTGAGVQVTEVTRRVDYGLMQELNRENAQLQEYAVVAEYFERMQSLFGRPGDNNSIAHLIGDLADEIEALALDPNETGQHLATARSAETVSYKLNSMGETLQRLRLEADQAIEDAVRDVNELLHDIHNLNQDIANALSTGKDGTDLLDQREKAVQDLTALMNITTFERNSGELTVFTQGGDILLDQQVKELSHTSLSGISALLTKGGNDITGIRVNNADITDDIKKGKLAALIEMRDSTLTDYQAQLDELAAGLKETVNLVNNRGTSYPNLANQFVGTRTFLDSTTQTISMDADHNTIIALFDSDGTQVAQTDIKALVATLPGPGDLETGETVADVASVLDTWLKANADPGASAAVNADGVLEINLNTTAYGLAFRDENTTAATSTQDDAEMSFDMDGDGTNDTTVNGFSNFFGLNDIYTTAQKDWVWDSDIKSASWSPMTAGTLTFSDNDPDTAHPGAPAPNLGWGSISIAATDTIQDIADKINATGSGLNGVLEAEVVREGDGVRLRLKQLNGYDMAVTQAGGTGLIDALGLEVSNGGLANTLKIKDEIVDNPSLISRGAMIYNSDTTEYSLSPGDNSTANALAEALRATQGFERAGDLPGTTKTLAEFAAMTVSANASEAARNESRLEFQFSLVDTLSLKNAEISAVNLDEELAELIIFEQSYAASARVISTISDMFDILNSIL